MTFHFYRYHVKATLNRPGTLPCDKTATHVFSVKADLDLNQVDGVEKSANITQSKKFCCCFSFLFGPLSLSIHPPRVGYVPGEDIPVSAEIENLSNQTMENSSVRLSQVVEVRGYKNNKRKNGSRYNVFFNEVKVTF